MRARLAWALVLLAAGPAGAGEQLRINVKGPVGGPHPSSQVLRVLTVSVSGSGVGTVTGTGIACPGDCTDVVDNGVSLSLTATVTPAKGSSFTGWSGACTLPLPDCTVLLNDDKATTATFTFTGWQLAWDDNSTDETNFELERRSPCSSGIFALVASPVANAVAHTDATSAPGTTYEYRIRATNSGGPSVYSNTLCVTP